jgi:hypothetical protein
MEAMETYLVIAIKRTHRPKPINPIHGEIAKITPPVVATPLPPDLLLDSAKLNFVLNSFTM